MQQLLQKMIKEIQKEQYSKDQLQKKLAQNGQELQKLQATLFNYNNKR